MTAGNNGANTPEDDDPFGYLYADGQASGATPPSGGGGYGYPGPRSYNQVRPVGERKYGGPQQQQAPAQQPTAAYGQVPPQQQYGAPQGPGQYGAPQAPGQYGGGPQGPGRAAPAPQGGQGRGRGPNTKGLLIGAVAVVAAVVVGITVVMMNGDDADKDNDDKAVTTPSATAEQSGPKEEDKKPGEDDEKPAELPSLDAKALKLEGGTSTASDVEGSKAAGGVYVTGFNQVGASVTWTINDLPDKGQYTVYVGYGVPGKDADATLTINGTAHTRPFNLKNYAGAPEGDLEKGWTESYGFVDLNEGTNTIKLSCETGNSCDANIDRVWLIKGWKEQ
ncbi:carbohydrate-binding protein [Streptomyces uncialis]|uniref:carbohydrate-binding protein n=1 Tax=Streptomyces uncialis TaxID=1048205 RepID=UPI00386A3268|nr:carbohydrate-binding protein [Streptomyces uncialis]